MNLAFILYITRLDRTDESGHVVTIRRAQFCYTPCGFLSDKLMCMHNITTTMHNIINDHTTDYTFTSDKLFMIGATD